VTDDQLPPSWGSDEPEAPTEEEIAEARRRDESTQAAFEERLERNRRRRARMLVAGGGVVLAGLLLGPAGRRWLGGDDDDDNGGNDTPTETVAEAPDTYRVTYEVSDASGVYQVVRTVNRPFAGTESRTVPDDDAIDHEIYTALGYDLSRARGEDWTGVVGVGTAIDETRFDATLRDALRVGLLTEDTNSPVGEIAGRSCTRYLTGAPLDEEPQLVEDAGDVRVQVCIDDETNLVLEERVEEDGSLVRHSVAQSVQVEPTLDAAALRQPTEPLSTTEGGGRLEIVRPDQRANIIEAWRMPTPGSYEFVNRFLYLEPTLGVLPAPVDATTLPLQTVDVFLRNRGGQSDMVLLFQGQDPDLPPPPPWAEEIESDTGNTIEIVGFALNEIRLESPEGVFARLVGTVPMSELRGLASTVERLGPLQ
jgi:hypothetical protein